MDTSSRDIVIARWRALGYTLSSIGQCFGLPISAVVTIVKYTAPKEYFALDPIIQYASELLRETLPMASLRSVTMMEAREKYASHKGRARVRNVPWEFTFESWWKVWQDSGKWGQRGRGAAQYCMARQRDSGAYSPKTVRIVTNSENHKEYFVVQKQNLVQFQNALKRSEQS